MINKLSIRNFKSVKELDIDCARVNLFIGEPNTGKSNILEALGLLSWAGHKANRPLNEYVRFQGIQNLFYDENVENPIKIKTEGDDELSFEVTYFNREFFLLFGFSLRIPYSLLSDLESNTLSEELKKAFEDHNISLSYPSNPVKLGDDVPIPEMRGGYLINELIIGSDARPYVIREYDNILMIANSKRNECSLDYIGNIVKGNFSYDLPLIKFYKYNEKINKFEDFNYLWLNPPYGSNLFSIIMGKKTLREAVSNLFKDVDLRLVLKPVENILESQKQVDDEVYGYPYILASDTIRRMIFYNIAIDSNENSVLIFEEPETHAFPAYIKRLGEKIAFDETNQYFIVTHNPYLFLSIVENVPKREDVNVFMTYMKDYQTKVKMANEMEVSKLMRYDPFFNLLHMIEEEK